MKKENPMGDSRIKDKYGIDVTALDGYCGHTLHDKEAGVICVDFTYGKPKTNDRTPLNVNMVRMPNLVGAPEVEVTASGFLMVHYYLALIAAPKLSPVSMAKKKDK